MVLTTNRMQCFFLQTQKPEKKSGDVLLSSSGTAQQVFDWGGGAKEEYMREMHACGFLRNFSKVTENAIVTIKLLIFFHIFSDVAIGPENSPSLN